MNYTHLYVDAEQTTRQDVVDALTDFWESRGASLHGRELVDIDDDDDKLGYAISSVQDGRIVVTDSQLLDDLEHGIAPELAERLGAELHVHGVADTGQGHTDRLYRPEPPHVPRHVRQELWEYLYGPEEYVRMMGGGYKPWDPEDQPADPSWMRPYLDELERMRRELVEASPEAPDLASEWTAEQYGDFADAPDRAPSDAEYLVFEGLDPELREEVEASFRGFRWVVGPGRVVDVREQFDAPLQLPVDRPETMRELGFLPVEPIDNESKRTRIAVYIDGEQTWGWVAVSDGTVWDAGYIGDGLQGIGEAEERPHYVSDAIREAYADAVETEVDVDEVDEEEAVAYFL
jgi:hypothetical protein